MITIRWKRRLFQRRDQLARKGGGSVESGHRKSNGSDRIRVKPRKTNHRREGGVVCVVVLAGKEEQCDGRQGQLWKRSSEDGISAKLRGTLPQSEEKSRTPTTASTHRLKIPMRKSQKHVQRHTLQYENMYSDFSHANEVREAIHAFHISSERSFG